MFLKKHGFLFAVVLFLILGAGVSVFLFNQQKRLPPQAEILSFEECVKFGNSVLESYPAQCKTQDGKTFIQDIGNELEMIDMIVVDNPRPNQKVTSPLTIKGRARGTYFFEATFPVVLVDEKGQEIAQGFVEASGDWMTEAFVPFVGELSFEKTQGKGTLFLKKDNPSGLPENDQTLEIPVKF